MPPAALVAALFVMLGGQQLLLWRFLTFGAPWLYLLAGIAMLALGGILLRQRRFAGEGPSVACLLGCAAVALIVLIIGGEGRFFYANLDWTVRDAVLRDMIVYPWPYAYTERAVPELLRAPIGMYLLPALAGKAFGGMAAADMALLVQNGLFFGLLLALGSTLFDRLRARLIALGVFVFFSGMDVLGSMIAHKPLLGHIEGWAGTQFSSHITQAFWVPQHALAGWMGALFYLLWKEARLSLAAFLAAVPLLAIWSPLSVMGIMPFAAHAGLRALVRREIRPTDILLPLVTSIIAVPGLLYLQSGSGEVGAHVFSLSPIQYVVFMLMEAVPYLAIAFVAGRKQRVGGATLAIVALTLAIVPFGQIGLGSDFAMRVSIPALAILSLAVADLLNVPEGENWRSSPWRSPLLAILLVGAITPIQEIWRGLAFPSSPPPLCNLFGASVAGFGPIGAPTYFARLSDMSDRIRPANVRLIPPGNPSRCWDRPWPYYARMAQQFK